MRADEINGVDQIDDMVAAEAHEDLMLDFEPGEACPPGIGPARRPSTGAVSSLVTLGGQRRTAAPRFYSGDELAAQAALRPYTGNVLWVAPASMAVLPCDLATEFYKNDGSTAGTGRAA